MRGLRQVAGFVVGLGMCFAGMIAADKMTQHEAVNIADADYQHLHMIECAWCHRQRDLNRHHIKPQASSPELRNDMSNLVVLCRDCHLVLGHRGNWKRANPDVMTIIGSFTNVLPNVGKDNYGR